MEIREQAVLYGLPYDTPEERTTAERFLEFHADNPWVYDKLVALGREMLSSGHKRIGMKMLFEVVRWTSAVRSGPKSGWKLNNNFTQLYSRLIMSQEPDLGGAFEIRKVLNRGAILGNSVFTDKKNVAGNDR